MSILNRNIQTLDVKSLNQTLQSNSKFKYKGYEGKYSIFSTDEYVYNSRLDFPKIKEIYGVNKIILDYGYPKVAMVSDSEPFSRYKPKGDYHIKVRGNVEWYAWWVTRLGDFCFYLEFDQLTEVFVGKLRRMLDNYILDPIGNLYKFSGPVTLVYSYDKNVNEPGLKEKIKNLDQDFYKNHPNINIKIKNKR